MNTDPIAITLAVLGILIGGVLKGATGAGAPIVAVPMLAVVFDVPTAVTIFTVPNLLSNIWQAWSYRGARLPWGFTARFAIAGLVGAGLGTVILARLLPDTLLLLVAVVVFLYVGFRLVKPDWALAYARALPLAAPIGFLGGILQGAVGVSAPISVTFLNALKLERAVFISTIAVFFTAMSLSQLPLQIQYGLMTWNRFALGLGTLALIVAAMPLGAYLARRISRDVFDKCILGLLLIIAVRLVISAL